MFKVTRHGIKPGLNHVSLPPGSTALTVTFHTDEQIAGPLKLWCRQPEIPPMLNNHIFLVAREDEVQPEANIGQKWQYVGSAINDYGSYHVFELVPDRVVGTRYGYGEQLAGEGR
jgi:hypothetical protein